jgi:hypothetical protein
VLPFGMPATRPARGAAENDGPPLRWIEPKAKSANSALAADCTEPYRHSRYVFRSYHRFFSETNLTIPLDSTTKRIEANHASTRGGRPIDVKDMLRTILIASLLTVVSIYPAEAQWWLLLRGGAAAGGAEAAAAGAAARAAAVRAGTARSLSNGLARGAGQAVGRAAVNGALQGGYPSPAYYPPVQSPAPQYYQQQQYAPQRSCSVVYQRQLVGRQFTGSEVVGVYRTPYGTTVRRVNHFVNQWRSYPVRVCS